MNTNQLKKKEQERAARIANQNRQTLIKIRSFLNNALDNPLSYYETANEIYLLRTMTNIFDYTINRIDDVINLSDFDKPTKKLMAQLTKNLDELLDRLYKYSIDVYGKERLREYGDKSHEYNQMTEISFDIRNIVLHYLMYFTDKEDEWRNVELNKFFNNIITEDAKQVKAESIKADIIAQYSTKLEQIDKFLKNNPEVNINK